MTRGWEQDVNKLYMLHTGVLPSTMHIVLDMKCLTHIDWQFEFIFFLRPTKQIGVGEDLFYL